jgi:hypothetical protein
MRIVDHFCPRVDVVPNYRLITWGSMSMRFNEFAYRVVVFGKDFGHFGHYKQVWYVTCSPTFSQSRKIFKVIIGYSRSILSHAKGGASLT